MLKKYKIDEISINLDNLRKPLNNVERNKISKQKLYPYYGANNLMDYVDEYIFDEEIICVAEDGGNWGKNEKCSYIVNEKCWINNHAHVLKVKDLVDIKYLYYLLNYSDLNKYITGTTRGKLTKSALNNIEILLPERQVQNKIIGVLNKAEECIQQRKEQINLLDELVKSKFIDMFGNFIYEKDKWSICEVGEVANIIDPQPSHRTPPESLNGIPYIGIADCDYKTGCIDLKNVRRVGVNVLQEHLKRYSISEGDFIIGKIGTIGKPFRIPSEQTYTLSANTVLIKANCSKVSPQFLFALFQSEYLDRIIDVEKKSTSQPAFGIQKVRKIMMPLPPIELQKKFAAFSKQVDKLKFEMEKSLKELQDNFDSLMQRAFSGELF